MIVNNIKETLPFKTTESPKPPESSLPPDLLDLLDLQDLSNLFDLPQQNEILLFLSKILLVKSVILLQVCFNVLVLHDKTFSKKKVAMWLLRSEVVLS